MMSESGKKTTTVIACTTFETIKVSDPIVYYEADRAHIIYMSREGDERKDFFEGLVEDIKEQIKSKRDVEIITHNAVVYRYGEMLRTINSIIKSEREQFGRFVDIYVNISSGSSEYAAAAMFACMLDPQSIPFTVRVKEHNIPIEKYRAMIEPGAPFGDAKSVYTPKMVETFSIEPPKEEMVRYLAFFASLGGKTYTNVSIMRMMEEADIWKYNDEGKTKSSASMQFKRGVLDPLLENGWIIKAGKNRWELTISGKVIVDIFCDEEEMRSYREIIESLREIRYTMCKSLCESLNIDFEE